MSKKGDSPDCECGFVVSGVRSTEKLLFRQRTSEASRASARYANEFAASKARSAKKPLFRHSPGRTPVEPGSARYANGLNYILTKVLFTH